MRSLLISMIEGGAMMLALQLYAEHPWPAVFVGAFVLIFVYADGRLGWSRPFNSADYKD